MKNDIIKNILSFINNGWDKFYLKIQKFLNHHSTKIQDFLNKYSTRDWLLIWFIGIVFSIIIMIVGECLAHFGVVGQRYSSTLGFIILDIWGLATVFFVILYFLYLPVKKNQLLYGGNTKSMLLSVSVLIISMLFAISGINTWTHMAEPEHLIVTHSPENRNRQSEGKQQLQKDTKKVQPKSGKKLTPSTSTNNEKDSVNSKTDSIDNFPYTNESKNFWAVVSQFADPGNLPQAKGYSRILAMLLAFLGIFCLSGLMLSSLVDFLTKRRQNWLQGLILYKMDWSLKDYVLIIGINEQTASIVTNSLSRNGVKNVLIQTRKDVEKARMVLGLSLEDKLEDKIVFYSGERTSVEDIAKLKLERAVEVYILGEDINYENEKDHDSFNLNCLEYMSDYISKHKAEFDNRSRKLRIHVDFEYQSTFTAFKATNLFNKLHRRIEFVPFNVHEIWSKKVLVDNFAIVPSGGKSEVKVQRYFPIDTYVDNNKGVRVGITEGCKKSVHLIIFGMNQMGTAFATQAALICHYPNFFRDKSLRTTITFIDDHALEESDFFMGRFSTLFELCRYRTVDAGEDPMLHMNEFVDPMAKNKYDHLLGKGDAKGESFLDIQWEFIQGNIASKSIQNYIEKVVLDKSKTTTIAICFNHSQQSIASAMYLPANIFTNANQVLVYQQNIFDVVNDVSGGDSEWNKYMNLFPFGMIESSYTENQYDNTLAKLENYLYKRNFDDISMLKASTLLDDVDSSWNEIEIVQKLANIDSVDSIPSKLRSLGVKKMYDYAVIKEIIDKKDLTCICSSEHLRWLTERLIMGFRCLTSDEQKELEDKDGIQRKNLRTYYKIRQRAHLDICSSNRITEIDPKLGKNDRKFISNLPELIRCREKINALHLFKDKYSKSQHVSILKQIFGERDKLLFHYIKGLDTPKTNLEGPKSSFWISEIAVSQDQWMLITGQEKKDWSGGNMPVVNVSKKDIDDFLDILNKKTGLRFAIPTIEEWRYAAEKSESRDAFMNLRVKGVDGAPVPVNSHPNVNKLYPLNHMLGNVWEWTCSQDEHGRYEFCGASFRFQDNDTHIENYQKDDDQYWHNPWDEEMKSDDLGFRLVWKYDDNDFNEIESDENVSKEEQVCAWFKELNHGMKLVKAKERKFTMGKTRGEHEGKGFKYLPDVNETPKHDVIFSQDYFMCKIPVTQGLWNILMGGKDQNPTTNRLNDNVPQTDVNWEDVSKFIKILNTMKEEGKLDVLMSELDDMHPSSDTSNLEFRLPTEAEWEYAAKGGEYCEVFLYSGSDDSEFVAWYGQPTIQEVAQKQNNALGLYDMSGNVWEWCYDYYISDMYDACINKENPKIQERFNIEKNKDPKYKDLIIDPVALDKKYSAHVFRGGSWRSSEWDCRCSRANFWNAEHHANDLGFRLVLGRKIEEPE